MYPLLRKLILKYVYKINTESKLMYFSDHGAMVIVVN